jgi:LPXTG-motif cell wall-anchored protein
VIEEIIDQSSNDITENACISNVIADSIGFDIPSEEQTTTFAQRAFVGVGDEITVRSRFTIGPNMARLHVKTDMDDNIAIDNVEIVDMTNENTLVNDTTEDDITLSQDYLNGLTAATTLEVRTKVRLLSSPLNTTYRNSLGKVSLQSEDEIVKLNGYFALYSGTVYVQKFDEKNEYLSGAEFVLAKVEGTGDSAKLVYYKKTDSGIDWVSKIDNATSYSSTDTLSEIDGCDTNVAGVFDGLGYDCSYQLLEYVVPDGYYTTIATSAYAPDEVFSFDLTENPDFEWEDDALRYKATVTNYPGAPLPTTGGMGTTIFYMLGGLLIAVSLVVLIARKKMKMVE